MIGRTSNSNSAKRRGVCIGLYLSLFDVSDAVVKAAGDLNREGLTTIVLGGAFWDDAAEEQLPMSEVLHYMVANARSRHTATPKSLAAIRSYTFDLKATSEQIVDLCRQTSATFLRRHKLERHEDLYVPRAIDRSIIGMAEALKPSALESRRRENRHDEHEYTTARVRPAQICVIRDASGAGKTTCSIQIAMTQKPFFGLARAAVEPELDSLTATLSGLGDSFGLEKLRVANQSILVAIDSLDEAGHVPHKAVEINSLLRSIDALNRTADARGLLAFPIGLVFTVREDYWERWNSNFEGRRSIMLQQRVSTFGDLELDHAFSRYSSVYGYRFRQPPSPAAKRVLAVPVNLLVFSEAHKFEGVVDPGTVLSRDVLALYFARKKDDVLKRYIPGFNGRSLMRVAGATAMHMTSNRVHQIGRRDLLTLIGRVQPNLLAEADEIARIMISEQILTRDGGDEQLLRFRHGRFVEYLVAYNIALSFETQSPEVVLHAAMEQVYAAPLVSPYRVYDVLKHICEREWPEHLDAVKHYFSSSSTYMGATLSRLRSEAGRGGRMEVADLELISKSSTALDPDVARDAFFVLAAKRNGQSKERVLEAFNHAWTACEGRTERWKMLQKLGDLGYVNNPQILSAVMDGSGDPKEWEVFLGLILERGHREQFRTMWSASGADLLPEGDDWSHVRTLAELAMTDTPYVPGVGN